MKGFGEKLLNRPRHVSLAHGCLDEYGAVVAVTQWLVRATDDRVVTATIPVRLPHIAWGTALPVSFGDTISHRSLLLWCL